MLLSFEIFSIILCLVNKVQEQSTQPFCITKTDNIKDLALMSLTAVPSNMEGD